MMAAGRKMPPIWLALLPYLLTGLLPLVVGTLLVGACGLPVSAGVFAGVLVAAAALILAAGAGREAFAPGVGLWPALDFGPASAARRLALGCLALAAGLLAVMQFSGLTGDWTIPLGGLGILGGYFYFAPPVRWHYRGLGELVGALGFGLLPVGAGFYLQSGRLVTEILVYGFPLSLAAFNLFLIHGFPRPGTAPSPGEGALAERFGPLAGALVYTVANILTIAGLFICVVFPAAPLPSRLGLWPLMVLAVVNQEFIKRRAYRTETGLVRLCRLTLSLHLGMGLVFALGLWLRL
jgi:1,4-dihydroxy-2-naphthoate octaprenyltransferase